MPSPATFSRNGRCSAKKKKVLGPLAQVQESVEGSGEAPYAASALSFIKVERLPMLLPLCHLSMNTPTVL
jgi:hypothetical protein